MTGRRSSELQVNFDGLTDSVTNLVGSLILLVMLVVVVTIPKQQGVTELPPPDKKVGAQQPIDPLLKEIRSTRDEARQVDHDIRQCETRLPEIADEIEELRRQLNAKGG